MKNINDQSKNPRGSSPQLQEPEIWIEDGANGSHWVKMIQVGSQEGNRVNGSHDQEHSSILQTGAERCCEDDGGNGVR